MCLIASGRGCYRKLSLSRVGCNINVMVVDRRNSSILCPFCRGALGSFAGHIKAIVLDLIFCHPHGLFHSHINILGYFLGVILVIFQEFAAFRVCFAESLSKHAISWKVELLGHVLDVVEFEMIEVNT